MFYFLHKLHCNKKNLSSQCLKENFKYVLPIEGTKLAIDAGSVLALNMVLLGAVTADDNFPLSKDSVIDAMKNNLKPKFKEIIMLYEIENKSYEEISKELKCPIGTVKSRLYNAKKELADALQDLM